MKTRISFLFSLSILAAFLFSATDANSAWDDDKGCLSCHEGIENFSDTPRMSKFRCTKCHKGDGEATEMEAAHKGMYANPTDLWVVGKTCGTCHSTNVRKVKKSLHATMAGMISGTRYDAGAQDRKAIYATYAVDKGETDREGAVAELKQIPSYDPAKPEGPDNSIADDYLRNQCLRCHLWSDGHQRDGDWRASGCAACHVLYSDNGTYEGGDKAIPKDQKDRPILHKMTIKITAEQCIHCHNRGGRTGVSFIGTMESDKYGTPWKANGDKQGTLHGKQYNHLSADVHYEMGLTCIDCHTKDDLHGDGYIYAKKENAVEIRCVSCHGTTAKIADMMTARRNLLTNLKLVDGSIILTAKLTGKEHTVPQLAGAELSEEGHTAMVGIPAHMEKLECYACHARWAPQCYGCHALQNIAKPSGDWINTTSPDDRSKAGTKQNREQTSFSWSESRSYLRWETPVLGINNKGKVSPFIPGCQLVLSQVDDKKNIISNRVYTTVDGTSGFSQNPIQPHTISRESRTCVDCHASRKALGLGTGTYNIKANFPDGPAPVDFEPERIVDESGNQLQATNHEGARPFNKEEMEKISRVGTCIACHASETIVLKNEAPTDDLHSKAIRKLLPK